MNIKKPRIRQIYDNDYSGYEREFNYKYLHLNAPAFSKLIKEISQPELKMLMSLVNIIEKNSGILLNLVGKPAENRSEILCAMGYISHSNTSKTHLAHMFKLGIIKRVHYPNAFCGYAYYVNPYIMYYGGSVEDTTLEMFQDSEWKEY